MNNLETAISILGSDNIEKIKNVLTELIIDDMRESCKSEWFVLPSQFDDMFNSMCEEVMVKLKKKYKKALTEVIEQKIIDNIEQLKGEQKNE